MAKSIQQWLDEYGSSHQNKTNKRIHLCATNFLDGHGRHLCDPCPDFHG